MCRTKEEGGKRCAKHMASSKTSIILAQKSLGLNRKEVETVFSSLKKHHLLHGNAKVTPKKEDYYRVLDKNSAAFVSGADGVRYQKLIDKAYKEDIPNASTLYAIKNLQVAARKAKKLKEKVSLNEAVARIHVESVIPASRLRQAYQDLYKESEGVSKDVDPHEYALQRLEARSRHNIINDSEIAAVDISPPGSQSHLYEMDENGRPKNIWYASYGSNLFRSRFMNYIKGGKTPGNPREYQGCKNTEDPSGDIAIRYSGFGMHFGCKSRVWDGGIGFIDSQESRKALGRAYRITSEQFDDVVHQENGNDSGDAKTIDFHKVISAGTDQLTPSAYGTMVHIGDYQGSPVVTFTAPHSTQDALARRGVVRGVMGDQTFEKNKPEAPYLKTIANGQGETFGFTLEQQVDYLRGCPGADEWSRNDLLDTLHMI